MFADSRREEDVRAALRRDSRIKHPELIAVSVDEIGTVVLRGAAGTLPERLAALTLTGYVREEVESPAAAEDVTGLTGVVGVNNRIEIG